MATCNYGRIRFSVCYKKNINEAYFDSLALYSVTFAVEYTCNSSGLPNRRTTLAGNENTQIYDILRCYA